MELSFLDQYKQFQNWNGICLFGVREKPGAREIPKNLQQWPQLRLLAIVEREHKLSFLCIQIGDYPNYHHRAFIQQLTEPDAEIHNQAPDWVPKIQSKTGEREYMS